MTMDMEEPEAVDTHPADVDLVAYADGELTVAEASRVAEHLRGCSRCRTGIDNLLPPIEASGTTAEVFGLPDDFPALFSRGAADDPVRGELWRLDWEGEEAIALVLEDGGDALVVAPATFEGPDDPVATEVLMDDSPVGAPLYLWHRLACTVPLGAFLGPVCTLPTIYLEAPAVAVSFGAASALLMAEVAASVAPLATAAVLDTTAPADAVDLLALLDGHATSELAAATGIPMEVITGYRRRQRRPTPDEAARIAAHLHVPVTSVSGALPIPYGLARAVQRPVHRIAIRLRAIAEQVTEALMRVRVAEGVLASPARTTGAERDDAAWDELVAQYLHE